MSRPGDGRGVSGSWFPSGTSETSAANGAHRLAADSRRITGEYADFRSAAASLAGIRARVMLPAIRAYASSVAACSRFQRMAPTAPAARSYGTI